MFVFQGTYKGKSKKTDKDYFQVNLFERRESLDKTVYFKPTTVFVEEKVYDQIVKQGFKFGDVVEIKVGAPKYFGGSETLEGLELVDESPYFDM